MRVRRRIPSNDVHSHLPLRHYSRLYPTPQMSEHKTKPQILLQTKTEALPKLCEAASQQQGLYWRKENCNKGV